MKFNKFVFKFNGGTIEVYALNYKMAAILAQAEAIERGWDYTIL